MTPLGKAVYVRDPYGRSTAAALGLLRSLDCQWALVNGAYPDTCRGVAAKIPTVVYALPEKFDDAPASLELDEWERTAYRLVRVADAAGGAGACLNLERGWAAATGARMRKLAAWLCAEAKRRCVILVTHDGLRRKFATIAAECSDAGVIASPEAYSHQIALDGDPGLIARRVRDWTAAGWTHIIPSVGSIAAPGMPNNPALFAAFFDGNRAQGTAAIWPASMSVQSRRVMAGWRP